jgi:hypothetical protein
MAAHQVMNALISKALRMLDDTPPLFDNAGPNDDNKVDKDDHLAVVTAAASVDGDDEDVMRGMARYICDQHPPSLFASLLLFHFLLLW